MKRGVLAPACGLKKLRGELRLTQKEVPDKTRITEPAYRAYERGGGQSKARDSEWDRPGARGGA